MVSCPYCGSDSPSAFNFCVSCERQVQCANPDCRAVLVAEKSRCLVCGKPLIAAEPINGNRIVRSVTSTGNTYTERVEIHATDAALSQLAPVFISSGRGRHAPHSMTLNEKPVQPALPFEEIDATLAEILDTDGDDEPVVADSQMPADLAEAAERQAAIADLAQTFFTPKGDTLVARVRSFKGNTKKEAQGRLVVMYVWAYQAINAQPVPARGLINHAAEEIGLYDPNFRKYFSRTAGEFLKSAGRGYQLNSAGERKVRSILRDMADSTVVGYVPA